MTKEIQLTQGKIALVDDRDFAWLSQWVWYAKKGKKGKWYAYRDKGTRLNRERFTMHRVIMNAPNGMDVDHKDNDGLNNQRHNLRVCTPAQNGWNKGKLITNTSGFKGVFKNGKNGWMARLWYRNEPVYLGTFRTPEEAARAYDQAAKTRFGEFAFLNFPE